MDETITLTDIKKRISEVLNGHTFDMVIGIARGGTIPGKLVAEYLRTDFAEIGIKYRDDSHSIQFKEPQVMTNTQMNVQGKKILIVDDVSRTGATLSKAKEVLSNALMIETLVVNGLADYSLYNKECFDFPWKS